MGLDFLLSEYEKRIRSTEKELKKKILKSKVLAKKIAQFDNLIEEKQRELNKLIKESEEKDKTSKELVNRLERIKLGTKDIQNLKEAFLDAVKSFQSLQGIQPVSQNENLEQVRNEIREQIAELKAKPVEEHPGIYLVEPHGQLIFNKKKRAIVKSRAFRNVINKDLILVSGKYAYGYIRLQSPKAIDIKEFEALKNVHRISDAERIKWWGKAKKLYLYKIKAFYPFERRRRVRVPAGVQTFIRNVQFAHELIKDINYDPSKVPNDVLADDFRIAMAWYASIKQGKKMKYTKGQIISVAAKIYHEMKKRGFKFHPEKMKKSSQELLKLLESRNYQLPIYPGNISKRGSEIKLSDFLKKWDSFRLTEDAVTLVGSLANWGKTTGDVDILVKAEPDSDIYRLIEWRIHRAYPEYSGRIHVLPYDNWRGPFTSHVHLGDLGIIKNNNLEVHVMSKSEHSDFKRDPDFRKEALISEKEDKVVVFRPFFQEKPQHGRQVGQPYTIENLIPVVNSTWPDWKKKGIWVGIKRDGGTCQVHYDHGKVKIWMEDGEDVTENLPTLVSQFAKKPGKCVVIGELEWYHNGRHMPRADSAGIYNRKGDPRESEIRITIYDKFYSDSYKGDFGDIHKKSYDFRRKQYTKITPDKNIFISEPEFLVYNEKDLIEAVKKTSKPINAEGSMLKLATAPYPLTIHPYPPTMIKFKKEHQLIAKVIKVHQVKGANAFVYDCALKDAPYAGRTYNTSIKAEVGDHIKVSFVDISGYIDPKTGKEWVNWWAPHVIEKTNKPLDSIKKAMKFVRMTTGRIQDRRVPKEGLEYHPETARGFSEEPEKKEFGKKRRFVWQHHFRGATEHIDFRIQKNHVLSGFTLANQTLELKKELDKHWKLEKKGKGAKLYWDGELYYEFDPKENIIKKPSKELERKVLQFHKRIAFNSRYWKIDMKTGEEKKRKGSLGGKAEKVWATQKTDEPYEWLFVEGVTPPRTIEESPGGTRFYPGIFVIIDSGYVDYGAQKPYFKEYFLKGMHIKGRVVLREVKGLKGSRKILDWLYWKPDDQSPYVLSKRAIKDGWLPDGYSALPQEIEYKVPPNLVYWNTNVDRVEREKRRKILAERFNKEMSESSDFILSKRTWKGQTVVRDVPVDDYHILLPCPISKKFHLDKNPIFARESTADDFTEQGNFFKEGTYPPKSSINPNKKIPAKIEILDKGKFKVIRNEPNLIQVEFEGNLLKGLYVIKRTSKGELWSFIKQGFPKTHSFMFKDYKLVSHSSLKNPQPPYIYEGIAFAPGVWNKTKYDWSVLKNSPPIKGINVVMDHGDGTLDQVGKVIKEIRDDKKKVIKVVIEFLNTEMGKEAAARIENGLVNGLSPRVYGDYVPNDGHEICSKIYSWEHLALVLNPACDNCRIAA